MAIFQENEKIAGRQMFAAMFPAWRDARSGGIRSRADVTTADMWGPFSVVPKIKVFDICSLNLSSLDRHRREKDGIHMS